MATNGSGTAAGLHSLVVVTKAIADLKSNDKNPRRHSPSQIAQLSESIRTFGFNVPVLIDQENRLISGHGRVLAAKRAGIIEVPAICLSHLSEARKSAFIIADNRLTENSRWDEKLLAEQLRDLANLELDFSLDATGFEVAEIDVRIESLNSDLDDATEDSLPPSNVGPVSQPGDLWLLGGHRVYCGSALTEQAYMHALGGKRAQMVFIDPPYNVPIDGHATGLGTTRHREFAMASGEMGKAEFTELLNKSASLLVKNSVQGSIHYIFMDWRHSAELLAAGEKNYSELKNIAVWVKNNAGMGSFYRSQHEFVLVFKAGGGKHRNNIKLGKHGRNRTNVWSYPGANTFGRASEEGPLFKLHPTVKPVRLVADCILDCTERGEFVLDSYLGSGTTVIAAERTGRTCCGIEIDPVYVDLVVRRWQAYTGERAKHAVSGKMFDDVAAGNGGRGEQEC